MITIERLHPVLFIDLHGVLVQTPLIFEEYRSITIKHLMKEFNLTYQQATRRYDNSFKSWENTAFDYLRNPTKKKVGPEFLDFLEQCDKLFPKLLYAGLEVDPNCQDLRTRPFEFAVASKVEALYPEVRETLERLQHLGYEMHVASSSHSSHIKGILEGNNINQFFGKVIGFDTVAATKHTLKFYKQMLYTTDAPPNISVMIGNSIHEVLKPKILGMKTIHINRERKVPYDIRKKADLSLTDISSLPARLDTLQLL